MKIDARRLVSHTLEADLCVIGSGPAGLAVAREFVGRDSSLVVLESGDHRIQPERSALSRGSTIGDSYADLELTRARRIGGTPHLWNTWIGAEPFAKYVPLDRLDFAVRPWVALSGWPISRDDLNSDYLHAHALCGLGPYTYDAGDWIAPNERLLPLARETFECGVYQLGSARAFTERCVDQVGRASNVLLCPNVTVTELETDGRGRRVTQAIATCGPGAPIRVRARYFVLAAGGIENARLLLLSNRRHPGGLGNRSDWVGRCFMEHPRDLSGILMLRDARLHEGLEFFGVHGAPRAVRGRIGLREDELRRGRFHNLSITLRGRSQPHPRGNPRPISERSPVTPRSGTRPARSGATDPAVAIPRAAVRPATRVHRYLELEFNLEQAPDPANRVALGSGRDAFGQPQTELRWRWTEADRRQWARARAFIAEQVARSGVGRVMFAADCAPDPNAHHHMGTTRMSRDPGSGVVDADARVHDLENLFVAGSSVFPTGGFANPTLTIVALSLRLARHLDELLNGRRPALGAVDLAAGGTRAVAPPAFESTAAPAASGPTARQPRPVPGTR